MSVLGLRTASGAMVLVVLFSSCGGTSGQGPTPAPTYAVAAMPHVRHAAEDVEPATYLAECARSEAPAEGESWPAYTPDGKWGEQVAKAKERYRTRQAAYRPHLQIYSATGDYLNYGATLNYHDDPSVAFDERGVPMASYSGRKEYNPVTVAQYALSQHGRYLRGKGSADEFLRAADALLELQDENGALRYPFDYTYYLTGEVLERGWVSGLAQGQALSVYARAYALTHDQRYLEAGDLALAFLTRWHSDGGTMDTLAHLDPSLDGYVWFMEYPVGEPFYTLNGFTFTLLGLYDWSQSPAAGAEQASLALGCGMRTLERVLPYYDAGGLSTYDLGHLAGASWPNIQPEYHAIHIYTLYALNSVLPSPILRAQVERWREQVD